MQLLFPKEEEIMYAIWEIGHPCGLSEILNAYPELKRNTVAKVLVILQNKGYLRVDSIVKTRTRTGKAYAPAVEKRAYDEQKKIMKDLVESSSVKNGVLAYLSALVDTRGNDEETEDMIGQMEDMIQQYRESMESGGNEEV